MPQQDPTVGGMTQDQLLKVIREYVTINLPTHIPGLTVDDLVVTGSLTAQGSVSYSTKSSFFTIGASGMPAFQNSWVKNGSPYHDPAFIKTEDGWVRLRGAIKSGTIGAQAFVLPPGYTPASTSRHAIVSNGAFGIVDIATSGAVVPQSPSSNAIVQLDGIQFKAK